MWSKDGGKNLFSRNTGMGSVTVARLLINPKNTAILIAATSNGIIVPQIMGKIGRKL